MARMSPRLIRGGAVATLDGDVTINNAVASPDGGSIMSKQLGVKWLMCIGFLAGCVSEHGPEVYASRYDEAQACWQERAYAGEAERDVCSNVVVYARDEEGTLWRFGDDCLPPGYEPTGRVPPHDEACE